MTIDESYLTQYESAEGIKATLHLSPSDARRLVAGEAVEVVISEGELAESEDNAALLYSVTVQPA